MSARPACTPGPWGVWRVRLSRWRAGAFAASWHGPSARGRAAVALVRRLTGVLAVVLVLAPGAPAQARRPRPGGCIIECVPRLGLVSAFGEEAALLLADMRRAHAYVINGNTFTTGVLRGTRVVIVLTGVSVVNAAMLTQLLIDHFNVHHLVHRGIAGGVDPANHIGEVVIPETWAFPLEAYWHGDSTVPSPCGTPGDLACLGLQLSPLTPRTNADYQIPTAHGLVGTGLFMRTTFVRTRANYPDGEFRFDYPVDPTMFRVAARLHPALRRCGPKHPSLCVSTPPVLRHGGRGVTAPVLLANPAYREYVFQVLRAQSFDMETTAFAHVAFANQIPFIAFRSVSDLAGGSDVQEVGAFFSSGVAEANATAGTLAVLEAWGEREH